MRVIQIEEDGGISSARSTDSKGSEKISRGQGNLIKLFVTIRNELGIRLAITCFIYNLEMPDFFILDCLSPPFFCPRCKNWSSS